MVETVGSKLELLTPRERDCLRLLASGLETVSVAARLGISSSTLNKHLASAREKLAVARTAQALLIYQRQAESGIDDRFITRHDIDATAAQSFFLTDFLGALDPCATFDEAWTVLKQHLRPLGIEHLNFGIIAEPPGQITNGARVLRMDMPDGIPRMYEAAGGVSVDPIVHFVAHAREPVHIDNKVVLAKTGDKFPPCVRALGEALVDNDCSRQIIVPYRDSRTEAPLALVFVSPSYGSDDYVNEKAPKRALLEILGYLFVDFVQTRRLLSEVPGLSNRQKEALGYAARGFTVDESAEHMGVSTRFLEKTLAAARHKLGARTTSAAVFRAVTYRALV